MSDYKYWLTLHVLFAVLTIGPLAFLDLVGPAAMARGGIENLAVIRWIHKTMKLIGPMSASVLIVGLIMVGRSDVVELSDTWVIAAIVLFIAAAITGSVPTGKVYEAAIAKLEAGQSAGAEATRARVLGAINFVILIVIVFLMFDQPGA